MDGGGGSGPGANVDVLILIGKDRKLRFREQVSGGIASTELVSTSIDDDTFHDVELDVSAGKTFGVAIKVDGRGVPIPAGSEPRFLLDGPLRTLILGPSYADQATAATLFYDDFELR